MRRRSLLTAGIGVASAVVGCLGRGDRPSSESTATTTTASPTSTDTPDAATPSERPDTPTPTDTPESATSQASEPPDRTARPAPHLGSFVLWNDDDEQHRVGLTISRGDRVVVDEARDLPPGDAADVENPIETQGMYTVVARVDGERQAEREWRVESCESIAYLQVYVADGGSVKIRRMRRTVDPPPTCG